MRGIRCRLGAVLVGFIMLGAGAASADDAGFKAIFDGKSLEGWVCPDMSWWRVEDGAITAESTPEKLCRENQFLMWTQGEVDDFELKLKYRILGTDRANSGIQVRSQLQPDGHVVGYQCDLDRGGAWVGAVYDELGRKKLADRGQRATIDAGGSISHEVIGDKDALFAVVDKDGWNDYHITAIGNRITVRVNGKVMSEVIDHDVKDREFWGKLAVQLHSGPPMKVQFKDIRLKRLPLSDGRKKVVMVAGAPSHRPGDHEHRAGQMLLAKCLNDNYSDRIYAPVYWYGWPTDPTAFDNADAIVIYADGGGRHPIVPHLDSVGALMDKGVGLGCIHYAVEVEKGEPGERFLDWIGGYFEAYWSTNPHWDANFATLPDHPITRGVKPFTIYDEWYYHMRFRPNMEGVIPILSAVPPDETRVSRPGHSHGSNPHIAARKGMAETVMWARQRPDGGRGFGFTGSHFHKNWGDENHRRIMLNAIMWVAGADVPEGGVKSKVTERMLEENLDDKPERPARRNPRQKQSD